MNAVLADGGRATVVICSEGVEINYFLVYFIDSAKTLWRLPCPTPCEETPRGAVCSSIKTMPLEGKTAPSWWGCLCSCVSLATGRKSCSFAKYCSRISSSPNHNPQRKKTLASALSCSSGPYATAGQITQRRPGSHITKRRYSFLE